MVIVNFENSVLVSYDDIVYDRLQKVYRMIGDLDTLWARGKNAEKAKEKALKMKEEYKSSKTDHSSSIKQKQSDDANAPQGQEAGKKVVHKKKKGNKDVRWSEGDSDTLRRSPSDIRDISDAISPVLVQRDSLTASGGGKKRKWSTSGAVHASSQAAVSYPTLSHTTGLAHSKMLTKSKFE